MEANFFTDSLDKQNYDEIIDMIDKLYLDLYKKMLDYKNVSYKNEENNFEYLDVLVRMAYPQFSQSLIHISVLRAQPNHTYLEIINEFLSTYINLKNMYKDAEFEKKYKKCNPNDGEDILD